MHYADFQYVVNGYEYRTFDDIEDDNIKTFHYCYKDGVEIKMPREFYNTSPYSLVKQEDFQRYIKDLTVFIQG
jgi:hypothetical protein